MKGKLIVIDGTDGVGKETQTKLLINRLRQGGNLVKMSDFPRYGQRSATLVEDYLNGNFGTPKEVGPYRASIFYACDRFAASSEMKRWLESGNHIVSNRYVSANMGHQAGKIRDLKERDKFLEWLLDLEFGIFKIPVPDEQILLYADPAIGQKMVDGKGHRDYLNGTKKDIHEADLTHLSEAAEAYLYCADKFGWDVVDCTFNGKMKSRKEISDEVYKIAKRKIDCALDKE